MALVAMINVLLDAELLQQLHTTNTQQNLLLQTILPVATIKRVCDRLVKLGIEFVISIKQIEFHTTHIHAPHVCVHLIISIGHVNNKWSAVGIKLTLNGQRVEVLRLVFGNLLTVHRKALGKIAEAIHETDGTHINVRV